MYMYKLREVAQVLLTYSRVHWRVIDKGTTYSTTLRITQTDYRRHVYTGWWKSAIYAPVSVGAIVAPAKCPWLDKDIPQSTQYS